MGLQEDAEGIARALSLQVAYIRQVNRAGEDARCTIVPPYNPEMEAEIKLAVLLALDLDPNIEFDWSNWP